MIKFFSYIKSWIRKINIVDDFLFGRAIRLNEDYLDGVAKSEEENKKRPSRTEIINFILSRLNRETKYLEIGLRDPEANFNHIKSQEKYSVDPGIEFKENPTDFKLTSDQFFAKLKNNEVLSSSIKFDVIFIDGLHLAEQVDRDILNSTQFIHDDGFIVLHDCNPPTEWHTRYNFYYHFTPAGLAWSGTTWKGFLKWRFNPNYYSCCIDSDWGVGIINKKINIGESISQENNFYEINHFFENKKRQLNLISFEEFKDRLKTI